ncbi:histone-lysine N-methyltransferase 2C isoform X1, partial [Tachysurus ichikawai]
CVHAECVKQDDSELQDRYTCSVCKQVEQDSSEHAHIHDVQDAVLTDPDAAQGRLEEPLRLCRHQSGSHDHADASFVFPNCP